MGSGAAPNVRGTSSAAYVASTASSSAPSPGPIDGWSFTCVGRREERREPRVRLGARTKDAGGLERAGGARGGRGATRARAKTRAKTCAAAAGRARWVRATRTMARYAVQRPRAWPARFSSRAEACEAQGCAANQVCGRTRFFFLGAPGRGASRSWRRRAARSTTSARLDVRTGRRLAHGGKAARDRSSTSRARVSGRASREPETHGSKTRADDAPARSFEASPQISARAGRPRLRDTWTTSWIAFANERRARRHSTAPRLPRTRMMSTLRTFASAPAPASAPRVASRSRARIRARRPRSATPILISTSASPSASSRALAGVPTRRTAL